MGGGQNQGRTDNKSSLQLSYDKKKQSNMRSCASQTDAHQHVEPGGFINSTQMFVTNISNDDK